MLREKSGHIHGRFESNTKVTRDVSGNIRGRGSNRLLRLLKGNTPSAFVAGGVLLGENSVSLVKEPLGAGRKGCPSSPRQHTGDNP